jgi:hypothetical protein
MYNNQKLYMDNLIRYVFGEQLDIIHMWNDIFK